VLAGTNDLTYLENSAHQIIANLHAIHRYLRRRGSTPFPMTIPPWAGSGFFRPEREVVRLAVNRWILTQALALNLEPLLGDGAVPPALKAAYSDGDGIHPSGEGPKVIARALARAMRRHARAMQLHVLT
jgi:lysophospholipase L1-like esterase